MGSLQTEGLGQAYWLWFYSYSPPLQAPLYLTCTSSIPPLYNPYFTSLFTCASPSPPFISTCLP